MLRTLQTSISDPSAYAVNRVQHDDLLYCNTINYGRALFDVYLPNCRPVTKQNSQAEPAKFNVNFMRTTTDSVHLLCCIWSSSSCNKDGIQPRAASTEFCLVSTLPPVFDPYTLPLQNVVDRLKVLRFPEIAVYILDSRADRSDKSLPQNSALLQVGIHFEGNQASSFDAICRISMTNYRPLSLNRF